MDDPFQMQRELRYGAPVCDQVLTGRYFTIGYSWYFRQAKWTLEIVNRGGKEFAPDAFSKAKRMNNFRADVRIPHRFRASLEAYKGSGFDRGHLVASANGDLRHIENSETFLLSNMSPQTGDFNRQAWRKLEERVRELNEQDDVLETYVLNCPVFDFSKPIEMIGDANDEYGISVPVPHAFVKSVLAEYRNGALKLWTFLMENKKLDDDFAKYLVVTYDAEQLVGGRFWDRASGGDMHEMKKNPIQMW
ncbi:DNA/RNA non-specific endonuclease [Pontixanthobacter aquaemixtae]|uniref:Endonuclease n=1 Tax=Pontixanthobacter aquaemixtae TaxID=1958940 RepID=A0A844ZYY0_9SPHN|nr:DNA/RNA non-specific endonuclease [Pontixanthobacter aquaemixtae]MXO91947.1 DNA/RNA endonuclease G [Pontixanthobacter aquaemixtae]